MFPHNSVTHLEETRIIRSLKTMQYDMLVIFKCAHIDIALWKEIVGHALK